MSTRLAQVLRAGEAHRQSVRRTGTLSMEGLNDDTLLSILDALARGAPKEACEAASKWCTLNKRHRRMCEEAGDGMWHELKRRIFGADAETFRSGPGSGKQNFEDLCAADGAKRWLQGKGVENAPSYVLWLLGLTLAGIKAGGEETPEGRVLLIRRVLTLVQYNYDDHDLRRRADEAILGLCDVAFLYMLLENGTEKEKDVALDLLGVYANNHDYDYDYDNPIEQPEDHRRGYEDEKVGLLRGVFTDGNLDRKLKVVKLWHGLLRGLPDATAQQATNMASYASRMIQNGIVNLLVETITARGVIGQVPPSGKLRDFCAETMGNLALALYWIRREEED